MKMIGQEDAGERVEGLSPADGGERAERGFAGACVPDGRAAVIGDDGEEVADRPLAM